MRCENNKRNEIDMVYFFLILILSINCLLKVILKCENICPHHYNLLQNCNNLSFIFPFSLSNLSYTKEKDLVSFLKHFFLRPKLMFEAQRIFKTKKNRFDFRFDQLIASLICKVFRLRYYAK